VHRPLAWWLVVLVVLAVALPAAGQLPAVPGIPTAPTVGGNSIVVPLSLPGGITANLTVTFETVTHLSLANLGVSAQLVSPTDAGLLARLPANVAIPPGLPVLVRIEPTPTGGLAFTGIVAVEIASLTLPPTPDLRLVASPLGGSFTDLTDIKADTSYRVIGSKGGFSEFLAVVDHTPLEQAVAAKLDALDRIFAENRDAVAEPVRTEIGAELAALRAHVLAGETTAAIQEDDAFLATVERHSGPEIPDVWRAAHDRVNVAGLLRAAGRTLRFSLDLGRSTGP
jgi:hypothetical protein